MQVVDRRLVRQDTFDLRDQILPDDHNSQMMDHAYPSDEEHSVLEDDSDNDENDYMDDDDGSSDLSIPNESIDFDLVYALHSFAATVEGQANVVKGDSLFLMDDSNSYWWLVRVLKTQEVGYIPAENIETPFERLARLNKHRNVDLSYPTDADKQEMPGRARRDTGRATPSPTPGPRTASRQTRGVNFTAAFSVHRYPPAIWREGEEGDDEDDETEWDDEAYEYEDSDIAEDNEERERIMQVESRDATPAQVSMSMEPDDGMSWEEGAVEEMQKQRQASAEAETERVRQQQQQEQLSQQQRELPAQSLQQQSSREQLGGVEVVDTATTVAISASKPPMDPASVTETRKISMTPPVARTDDTRQQTQSPANAAAQRQSEERKRTREEEATEETRKKASTDRARVSSGQARPSGGAKLRKERDSTDDESGSNKKKKSGGILGGIFSRKKDKGKDRGIDSGSVGSRESEESGKSITVAPSSINEPTSPVTTIARQQQESGHKAQAQVSTQSPQTPPQTPPQVVMAHISQHASQLRQRDQQQQALYLQYLNRSPSTPPEAQPSYGLQSASAVLQGSMSFASSASSTSGLSASGSRPRPGSLVLAPAGTDGQGIELPDLNVVRVFAGANLQTEATFKTVLLNSSTTASDLVRQAIQRFRLPGGEDEKEYYLTIKQVEGSSAALLPHEKPLGVFEGLVEAALELPKVKRSSVGSISSVASNLSMHPAIKRLPMNDFTDDSTVKFYLNRKSHSRDPSLGGEDGDETTVAEGENDEDGELTPTRARPQYLSVNTNSPQGVTAERFSSPSFKFALQLVIYREDLPDDMVFDPLTEAIVFKNTLRDRSQSSAASPGISQTIRRKVFSFPRNVTVAEVIEFGLERFGIAEGVVDGGDEIEDKLTKRRSSSRVRYGLAVDVGGKERELQPSSKVIDAFPRPPTYRAVERPAGAKRRSVDSAQLLLGNPDDVQSDDPVFILRRAIAYRTSSSRNRLSAPLDEIALQQLHRDSVISSSASSDSNAGRTEETKPQATAQMSKQAIIAAQRAATRANQRAILSAKENSARGLDVLLPGNAMIRSSRYEVDDKMRYSYVEPGGETYDISEIVEEEWRGEINGARTNATGDDLLHGVLSRGKDGLGAKLDRVLSKIKHEKGAGRVPMSQLSSTANIDSKDTSDSVYSMAAAGAEASTSRTATPTVHSPSGKSTSQSQRVTSPVSRLSYRTASPGDPDRSFGSRSTTPGANQRRIPPHERQDSAMSDVSIYRTATPGTPVPIANVPLRPSPSPIKPVILPKDDFGLAHMMAVIELRASQRQNAERKPQDSVEELLFGKELDIATLHPEIRDIYTDVFKQLDQMDEVLENLLHHAVAAF